MARLPLGGPAPRPGRPCGRNVLDRAFPPCENGRMKRIPLLLVLVLAAPAALRADEGMWTYDNFPKDKVKQSYGFSPTAAWLESARLPSVRRGGGGRGGVCS